VAAVILSGALNDGTFGAMIVKSQGGTVIVQDPAEAETPDMPQSTIEHVAVDRVAKAEEIGPLLARLAPQSITSSTSHTKVEPDVATDEVEKMMSPDNPPPGELAPYVCPDCGGAMWGTEVGQLIHFQCHTGHSFTSDVLLAEQSEALENALWSAVRVIDERVSLLRRVAAMSHTPGLSQIAKRQSEDAADLEQKAQLIRKILLSGI
jgi:two-component system, chemotaxis family, protein-glutamate methylesterase/glutaminase